MMYEAFMLLITEDECMGCLKNTNKEHSITDLFAEAFGLTWSSDTIELWKISVYFNNDE